MIRVNPAGVRTLGNRWTFALSVVDAGGAPLDLTGGTITVRIAGSPGGTELASAIATNADQTTETGLASAVFLPDDTAAIEIPESNSVVKLYYQAQLVFDSDNKDVVSDGFIQVQANL